VKRLHLLELEDQAWFPRVIRDGLTDYLSFMAAQSDRPFRPFAAKLAAAMARVKTTTLVELGSGGGGPALQIGKLLRGGGMGGVEVVMTDLYPNVPRLTYAAQRSPVPARAHAAPVDACAVPRELQGFRLICNAFHHLPEPVATAALADAVAARQGFALLELVSRDVPGFLQVVFGCAIQLLAMPFVRPFRWQRLLFTYVLPVIPLATLWDGIVSCLRIYAPDELRALVAKVPDHDAYDWDIGHLGVKGTPINATDLIATPRKVV
jgi:hypothetical protein